MRFSIILFLAWSLPSTSNACVRSYNLSDIKMLMSGSGVTLVACNTKACVCADGFPGDVNTITMGYALLSKDLLSISVDTVKKAAFDAAKASAQSVLDAKAQVISTAITNLQNAASMSVANQTDMFNLIKALYTK